MKGNPQRKRTSSRWVSIGLLLVWTLVGAGLGYLREKAHGNVYESRMTIHVLDRSDTVAKSKGRITSVAPTHIMGAKLLVDRAQKIGGLRKLHEIKSAPDPTRSIQESLDIDPIDSNGVYRVTYRGPSARATKLVLESLLEAYVQWMGEIEMNITDQFLTELNIARRELAAQLKDQRDLTSEALKKSAELRDLMKNTDLRQRLQEIDQTEKSTRNEIARLEGVIRAIEGARARGEEQFVAGPLANSLTPLVQDKIVAMRLKYLEPLIRQQQQLLTQFGPDHARVKKVQRRIEITTQLLATESPPPEEAVPLMIEEHLLLENLAPGHPKVQAIRKEIDRIMAAAPIQPAPDFSNTPATPETVSEPGAEQGSIEEQLAKTRFAIDQRQGELEVIVQAAKTTRIERLCDVITHHLEEINLTRDSGGNLVRLLEPPTPPVQNHSNKTLNISVAALVGLMIGGVLAGVSRAIFR